MYSSLALFSSGNKENRGPNEALDGVLVMVLLTPDEEKTEQFTETGGTSLKSLLLV